MSPTCRAFYPETYPEFLSLTGSQHSDGMASAQFRRAAYVPA
jgi:hypothetical protein